MDRIVIKFRDGRHDLTFDRGAYSEGSVNLKYEPGFVVVTNRYGRKTAYPTDLIAEIQVDDGNRRSTW